MYHTRRSPTFFSGVRVAGNPSGKEMLLNPGLIGANDNDDWVSDFRGATWTSSALFAASLASLVVSLSGAMEACGGAAVSAGSEAGATGTLGELSLPFFVPLLLEPFAFAPRKAVGMVILPRGANLGRAPSEVPFSAMVDPSPSGLAPGARQQVLVWTLIDSRFNDPADCWLVAHA